MNKTFTEVLGTYQVPAWALLALSINLSSALINGDYSGLSDYSGRKNSPLKSSHQTSMRLVIVETNYRHIGALRG
jgi:hypothetical protein